MITFDQARQIVAEKMSPNFLPEAAFRVEPWGWENATHYQLSWSLDRNHKTPTSGPFPVVNKTTGEYEGKSGKLYILPNSTPVGANHPDLDE